MKYTKYSKYVGDLADEMSLEDLLSALSDYLLESGFQSQYMYFQQMDEHTLEEMRQQIEQMQMDGTLEQLVERLIERMQQEDFISVDQPPDQSKPSTGPGQ